MSDHNLSQNLTISDKFSDLDLPMIHNFLRNSYWCKDIPMDLLETAIRNSWSFGLFHKNHGQIGFARFVTDRATFGYLADVFILPEHQKKGFGAWFMDEIHSKPQIKQLRRLMLVTKDAHDLYRPLGYTDPQNVERMLEISRSGMYQK